MPKLRFHLLTIDHEMWEGGFTVTVTTNVACHLYLRYSDVFPRIHRKSVARRGLVMGWDARYCFVAYQHIEQNEAGDTSTHTFTWPGWSDCETRYFYFWGTIGGWDMVSDTPIFWLHYLWEVPPEPDPTSDQYQYATHNKGFCQYWNALSQTFNPENPYLGVRLSLMLNQRETIRKGPCTVKITRVNGDCWAEELLWSKIFSSTTLPLPGVKEWQHYALPPIPFDPEFTYRIVSHSLPGWSWWNGYVWVPDDTVAAYMWWAGITYPLYPRGAPWQGCNFKDSSGAWYLQATLDYTFIVWE
ncbi:hypothetical protein ES705_28917 [subsurface metagenome]